MRILIGLIFTVIALCSITVIAAQRFASSYPCTDIGRVCTSSGERIIDGFKISKDCWEWQYTRTCNYPSRDDCKNFGSCYLVANRECLLRDSMGNCVNQKKEISCESWQPITIDRETVSSSVNDKEGKAKMVCKAAPCIDGNCIDKSYTLDSDMMDSVAKLSSVSQMKGAKDMNFKLFEGFGQSCSKKVTEYTNCCSPSLKGWGKHLGAKCTAGEKDLIDRRLKNLCVYVGKENKRTLRVTTVIKHHYCCFGSLLNKVIQVEGRKQLGLSFGTADMPDCRGLTLDEIMRLDFERMDFSEFYVDVVKQMKLPNVSDISARTNSSLSNIRQYDGNPHNKRNNMTGINTRSESNGQ